MRVNKILLTANVNKSQISKTETHYKITGIPITVDNAIMNGVMYPADENEKGMNSMVGKPLTIGHPTDTNGNYVSALEGVGMQDYYSGGNITKTYNVKGVWYADAEVKTSLLNAQKNGPELAEMLDNKSDLGVSTGLFFSHNEIAGKNDKGESYGMTAINQDYNHLAALMNETPAGGDATVARFNSEEVPTFCVNELLPDENSQGEIYDKLRMAIKDKYPSDEYCWLPDVFETYFIYTTDDNTFYSQDFEKDDNGDVILIGEPKKVEKRWQTIVNALKRLNPFLHKDITKGYNVKDENINVNEKGPEMELKEVEQLLQANNDTQNKALADIVATAVNSAVEPLKAELDLVKQSVTANADKEKAELVTKVNALELGLDSEVVAAMNADQLTKLLAKHDGKPAGGVNTNSRSKPESNDLDAEMPE